MSETPLIGVPPTPGPHILNFKTVINDLRETITIQALDIAVTPPFVSNIETVTVPSGTTYGFQNVGALTLFDDNKHAYCHLTAGAQVFCASDVFIAAVPASHCGQQCERISSRSIAFVFVDLTVKYEVLIPGIAKPDVVERPEIQPGASHTFALGPIGADLILIGPNGESKSIKLTLGDQVIYTSEYFIVIGS